MTLLELYRRAASIVEAADLHLTDMEDKVAELKRLGTDASKEEDDLEIYRLVVAHLTRHRDELRVEAGVRH